MFARSAEHLERVGWLRRRRSVRRWSRDRLGADVPGDRDARPFAFIEADRVRDWAREDHHDRSVDAGRPDGRVILSRSRWPQLFSRVSHIINSPFIGSLSGPLTSPGSSA